MKSTPFRVLLLSAVAALALAGGADAATRTLVLRSQAIEVGPYGVVQAAQLVPSPGADGYVVGLRADLVDAAGRKVPNYQVMLHHVALAKLGHADTTCASFIGYDGQASPFPSERFFAEGEEREQLQLPPGYGYPNRAADHWGMIAMLMNHRAVTGTVFVRYTVRYATGERLRPVVPIWLDVVNCHADPIFNVPGTGGSGSTFTRSADFVAPQSGHLLAAGGHLHGGGLRLQLSDASCGRQLFTSYPTWRGVRPKPLMHEPGPSHMSTFVSEAGIPVAKGDRLRLSAVYENSLPHTRVMGIMMIFLAPGPVAGCAPVPPLPPDPLSHPGPPPRIVLPLLREPGGQLQTVASTRVEGFRFAAQRVSIRRGTTFTWLFAGPVFHDVTLASGPTGFASPSQPSGSFSFRFTRPGVYRLYCSLHPSLMTQVITVR